MGSVRLAHDMNFQNGLTSRWGFFVVIFYYKLSELFFMFAVPKN